MLVAGWFTTKITVDTNLIEYFKKSSPVRSAMDFVEKRLGGVNSLDISLQASEEDAFKDPINLKVIENLQNYIKSLKSVDVTISLVDFLKKMNKSFHKEDQKYYTIPESKKLVTQYLLIYASSDIEDFVNEKYDHARISVRISEHSSAKQEKLIETIRDYIQKTSTPNIDIKITGRVAKEVSTIGAIVQSVVVRLLKRGVGSSEKRAVWVAADVFQFTNHEVQCSASSYLRRATGILHPQAGRLNAEERQQRSRGQRTHDQSHQQLREGESCLLLLEQEKGTHETFFSYQ